MAYGYWVAIAKRQAVKIGHLGIHHTADEEKWGLNRSLVTYIESPRISPTDIVTGRATLREAERDAGKRLQRKRILLFNVED